MTELASSSSRPPIRCIISYAHDDETSLSFIDEFRSTLEHFTYADSGRRLEIFRDHDSIGWGDDWRERIRESINTALVFIPIVTLQYLDRPLCREEVQLFVDGARKLGVTELFLPVVVLGHRQITEQSTDPVAQLIARHQYMDLKQAVLQGTSSATWRATMLDLSEALVLAVEKAERHIVEQSVAQRDQSGGGGTAPGGVRDAADPTSVDDAVPGLVELIEQIDVDSTRIVELMNEFAELMTKLQAVMASSTAELKGADQAKGRVVLGRVAESTSPIAQRVDEVGTEMEMITARVDGAFRSAWALAVESGHESFKNSLRQSVLGSDASNFSGLAEVVDMMTDIFNQMKGVEVISVPMRTALRPLRKGLTSVRSAVSTVQAWPGLVTDTHTPPEALSR